MPMKRALVPSLLCLVLSAALAGAAAASPQKDPQAAARAPRAQASHLQRGLTSFEQGFYELLPKGRLAEAEQALAAAAAELELALDAEPANRDAHRALARICALRKDHATAAGHYLRLTEIDPYDIDSYALAALSLAEAGRYAESRAELEKAKARTVDPRALAFLDGCLAKLDAAVKKAAAER